MIGLITGWRRKIYHRHCGLEDGQADHLFTHIEHKGVAIPDPAHAIRKQKRIRAEADIFS